MIPNKCAHLHMAAASSTALRFASNEEDSLIAQVYDVKDLGVCLTYRFTPLHQIQDYRMQSTLPDQKIFV